MKKKSKKKEHMQKNINAYNHMYGDFLNSMKSVQKFLLIVSILCFLMVILYAITK